jgi:hypothetical protein
MFSSPSNTRTQKSSAFTLRSSRPAGGASGQVSRIYFRADAGFANPEVYEYLEAEGISPHSPNGAII